MNIPFDTKYSKQTIITYFAVKRRYYLMYEQHLLMKQLDSIKKFLLVVGNARSGTSLLVVLLDSFPSVILAY
jgi:hypothetical protein